MTGIAGASTIPDALSESRSTRAIYPETYGQIGCRARAAGKSADPERSDRLADEMTPFVAHPRLVLRCRLGDGEAGPAEHPERELDQRVEALAVQVPTVDQVPDEVPDQAVRV